MRLVRAEFRHIHLPMMADSQHMLYATTRVLSLALACTEKTLIFLHHNNKGKLSELRVRYHTLSGMEGLKEFLDQHRVEFGIQRVRDNMLIWSISDIMFAASVISTTEANEFREVFSRIIVESVPTSSITEAQYKALEEELKEMRSRIAGFENLLLEAQPALQTTASAAGSALSAQRATKHLRRIK